MQINVMLAGLGACLAIAMISSYLGNRDANRYDSDDAQRHRLKHYLLGNGDLSGSRVMNLMVSSSFGLNSLFYQVWLGYFIGLWGMLLQTAWALSYVLVARHAADRIRESRSLHSFLAQYSGPLTRIVAAVLSILGFVMLMGWEIGIARSTYAGLAWDGAPSSLALANQMGGWIAALAVFVCAAYTIFGGLRGNAVADKLLNFIKVSCFILVLFLLGVVVFDRDMNWSRYLEILTPSWSAMIAKIGFFALATNIAFSLIWQFVDASMWQNILASANRSLSETKTNLNNAAIFLFFAPGLLGTFLGAALGSVSSVTSDNIMVKAIQMIGVDNQWAMFFVSFAIGCSVMSLIDGLLLASSYATVVDLAQPNSSLDELDEDPNRASSIMRWLRLVVIILSIIAIWGVSEISSWFDGSLFDFLYLVVIPQMALAGPIFLGLRRRSAGPIAMTLAMVSSFCVGLGMIYFSQHGGGPNYSDGAGIATALISVIFAVIAASISRRMEV